MNHPGTRVEYAIERTAWQWLNLNVIPRKPLLRSESLP